VQALVNDLTHDGYPESSWASARGYAAQYDEGGPQSVLRTMLVDDSLNTMVRHSAANGQNNTDHSHICRRQPMTAIVYIHIKLVDALRPLTALLCWAAHGNRWNCICAPIRARAQTATRVQR
jgi:hypothetical protein